MGIYPKRILLSGRTDFSIFSISKTARNLEVWVENKRRIQLSRCLDYIKSELAEPLVCRDITRLRRLIGTWEYWKPWDEEMVLTGMKCYMQAEKYDWGIQMYHEYVKCLRRDLDEEPSHAVELLFRTMFHRKEVSLIRKTDRKDHFFGRLAELQYIDERIFWFLNHEPSASVVIEGEVGVGKTALMQQI